MAEAKGIIAPTLPRSYTDDYCGWVEDTARAIEDGRFSEIDRAGLADEVRDLGKSAAQTRCPVFIGKSQLAAGTP